MSPPLVLRPPICPSILLPEMRALRDGLRGEMAGLRGELRTIKWVLGGMFALMVPMLAGIIGIALQLAQQ